MNLKNLKGDILWTLFQTQYFNFNFEKEEFSDIQLNWFFNVLLPPDQAVWGPNPLQKQNYSLRSIASTIFDEIDYAQMNKMKNF